MRSCCDILNWGASNDDDNDDDDNMTDVEEMDDKTTKILILYLKKQKTLWYQKHTKLLIDFNYASIPEPPLH